MGILRVALMERFRKTNYSRNDVAHIHDAARQYGGRESCAAALRFQLLTVSNFSNGDYGR